MGPSSHGQHYTILTLTLTHVLSHLNSPPLTSLHTYEGYVGTSPHLLSCCTIL